MLAVTLHITLASMRRSFGGDVLLSSSDPLQSSSQASIVDLTFLFCRLQQSAELQFIARLPLASVTICWQRKELGRNWVLLVTIRLPCSASLSVIGAIQLAVPFWATGLVDGRDERLRSVTKVQIRLLPFVPISRAWEFTTSYLPPTLLCLYMALRS